MQIGDTRHVCGCQLSRLRVLPRRSASHSASMAPGTIRSGKRQKGVCVTTLLLVCLSNTGDTIHANTHTRVDHTTTQSGASVVATQVAASMHLRIALYSLNEIKILYCFLLLSTTCRLSFFHAALAVVGLTTMHTGRPHGHHGT